MKKNIIKFSVLFLFVILLITNCTGDFEKINTDPDRAKDAPATNVLAFSIRYWSSTFYDVWAEMNETSTYAGHLTKIQYIDEARYNFRPGVVENKWYYVYRVLNNVNEIRTKAEQDDNQNMLAVSKVFRAYVFQCATDTWRDIPYSDAIKIKDGVLLPKYDKQEDIYPDLLKELKEAADIFAAKHTDALDEGDLLFKGDIEKWQKFTNSLRLRLAMRISEVSKDLAKSTVEEVLKNPSKYPIMDSNDDNAFFWWQGTSPYEEPWFVDSKGRDDHGVSDVLINALLELNDPRISEYAYPAASDGKYRGFIIGATAQPALASISRVGERFRKDPKGFSPYMRYAEVMFLIAEAAHKGFATGGITEAQAYNAAVEASLLENGVSEEDITAYLAGKGKFNGTLDQLYLQEWIALFKQGLEAWSLYRRTGIPKTHYVAPGSIYPGHNSPPFRYPYPQNEFTLNGANIQPFASEVVDEFWGKRMWWDTRSGVN
ncbi:MAG TPA: SusD/RagB family nutrient-binding outer membrane lipoprotein [Petrimonas sp.]|mgnify:CR=1 FL=1|uniref:SusD/RagB family nutrient-binding outer membrane lipoprotein n=1 Tax=Petrimonas sp. TaxID=2023866 RepID=UPI00095DDDEC|nr:MAG: hypothetical protein BGO33_06925 [Bacteroidia bacterium 43-41]HHV86724.1 SusD/RagB family nutrient-binding outer membrane lipoprotein [Petrimonas sp.]